jgi:hypothetical protein
MSAQVPRTLSDWASIAEIASGVAVIVTLVVLILGVRENTEVVRASAYANSQDSFSELQLTMLTDPDSLRAWNAFLERDTSGFDQLDHMRVNSIVLILFRTFETAYFSERYGLIGEEEWRRLDRNICGNFRRARAMGREAILGAVMSVEFMEYMTSTCSD